MSQGRPGTDCVCDETGLGKDVLSGLLVTVTQIVAPWTRGVACKAKGILHPRAPSLFGDANSVT